MVHASLGEHSIVLDLRLADGGAVVADDHQLGYRQGTAEHSDNCAMADIGQQLPPIVASLVAGGAGMNQAVVYGSQHTGHID